MRWEGRGEEWKPYHNLLVTREAAIEPVVRLSAQYRKDQNVVDGVDEAKKIVACRCLF